MPARELDDLPGFFTAPPGSPRALPAGPAADDRADASTTEASAGTAADPDRLAGGAGGAGAEGAGRRWGRRRVALAGAVVVVAGAVVAAVTVGGGDPGRSAADSTAGPTSAATGTTAATTTPTPAAPLTAAAAGDLAGTDLAPGADGFTAEVSFAGVVLEPRAVGVTVAYPRLRASGDGERSVAHVELAVWNCLADTPPADPATADCRRGLVEYADLPSPELSTTRTGDGVQLTGSFPTYTRPNGSAPSYTGRSYTLDVEVADRRGTVTGTLRLGDGVADALPGGSLSVG
ncbi:hypothetical protein [Klenkia sp. PcliD-1-E]|uniref:hypothetical protein n=1 Tax=Klenkia sp. PcliD-1-E TaxID=2954492 RepID=UPI002097B620|nr:hypothetical protein [Klenkia sp. PcliD-1-E]MCO7219980.1 hypothetical protein [Klenkia sp. PcliD-1-E]